MENLSLPGTPLDSFLLDSPIESIRPVHLQSICRRGFDVSIELGKPDRWSSAFSGDQKGVDEKSPKCDQVINFRVN